MLEFYEAYQDYAYLMDFTESMLREIAIKVLGHNHNHLSGTEIDLAQPFARLTITQAIRKFHPEYTDAQLDDRAFLIDDCRALGIASQTDEMALAGYSLRYLTKPPSIYCLSRPSSLTIQPRFPRLHGATMRIPQ